MYVRFSGKELAYGRLLASLSRHQRQMAEKRKEVEALREQERLKEEKQQQLEQRRVEQREARLKAAAAKKAEILAMPGV